MTATISDRFEIKVVKLPTWIVPVIAAGAVALVALAGVIGFGVLLLMSPIILVAGAANLLKNRKSAATPEPLWPVKNRPARPASSQVIDGDYEVVDDGGTVRDRQDEPKSATRNR